MSEDNGKRNYGNPADVMMLLAREADDVIALAGKSARQEAEEETEKMLRQYEQRAKQIVLKIREETRARADEMAVRFREALILRVGEASTAALDSTVKSLGNRTEEIVRNLQDVVKKETRQALAEGLVAGDGKPRVESRPESLPESVAQTEEEEAPAAAEQEELEEISLVSEENESESESKDKAATPAEDFENWLMQ